MSRDAVIIAVDSYRDKQITPLSFAQADAVAVGETLRSHCGFNICSIVGQSATRQNVLRTMQSLNGGKTLLVYFALHGQMRHGCYLLHTYDSDIEGKNALTFGEVVQQCAVEAGYKEVAFVLDACRNSETRTDATVAPSLDQKNVTAVTENVRDIAAKIKTHVQNVTQHTTTKAANPRDVAWIEVLYGCSDGQCCYEDPDLKHGLFSFGLVGAMGGVNGNNLTLRQCGDGAARIINRWSNESKDRPQQQPMHYSQTGRNGILIASKKVSQAGKRLIAGSDGTTVKPHNDNLSQMSDYLAQIDNGRLVLLHLIGQGGMGSVWIARDGRLNRLVALKKPSGDVLSSETGARRFLREARTAAQLRHHSIVNIYNVHEIKQPNGHTLPLIEMEYIEGATLEETIQRGGRSLNAEEIVDIAEKLCEAMAEAHQRGILHRDIKPANIILSVQGVPKLVDFGLAMEDQGMNYTRYSMTGQGMGTLNYSSPEQLRGLEADERTDIYALGASLYYACTGKDLSGVLSRRDIPPTLVPVIEKACQSEPGDRYQNMTEFKDAIISAGRASVGGDYVRSSARCPKCDHENPETYKFCRHCGADLSELFRPCPRCEAEIRNDVAFCAACGCNVMLECWCNDITVANKECDYNKIRDLAASAAEQFPNEELFAEKLTESKNVIARTKQLTVRLETVQNDSDCLNILKELSDVNENYTDQYKALAKEEKLLEAAVSKQLEAFKYDDALKSSENATVRFPANTVFPDYQQKAAHILQQTDKLNQQIAEVANDGEQLKLLEQLAGINKNYFNDYETLKSEREKLAKSIRQSLDNHDYKIGRNLAIDALARFPDDPSLLELLNMSKSVLAQIDSLKDKLATAQNNSKRLIALEKLLIYFPENKGYIVQKKLLVDECQSLKRDIIRTVSSEKYRKAHRICVKATNSFPDDIYFSKLLQEIKNELTLLSILKRFFVFFVNYYFVGIFPEIRTKKLEERIDIKQIQAKVIEQIQPKVRERLEHYSEYHKENKVVQESKAKTTEDKNIFDNIQLPLHIKTDKDSLQLYAKIVSDNCDYSEAEVCHYLISASSAIRNALENRASISVSKLGTFRINSNGVIVLRITKRKGGSSNKLWETLYNAPYHFKRNQVQALIEVLSYIPSYCIHGGKLNLSGLGMFESDPKLLHGARFIGENIHKANSKEQDKGTTT